ncbi:DUF3718 domain-containing protein [Alteromonas sp. 5E99-2]|uniref:DUF3718 domain-containing protein n=1 Tax=Alteromonas sp. 5E99-2 TaxID=2817683 RepID=UPI001A97F53F|nr:DUF3718 domain-containing protein [Alteromonas sp. 5E99-2]MBO1255484.1 DUF3718 domain-containing protein [Alteromonas sp. 5E99-2]
MKTLTKVITTTVLTLSAIGFASASEQLVPTDSFTGTKLCVVAAKGNKLKLNRAINKSGMSKRYIVENLKCNGMDLVSFVEQHGSNSHKINTFLAGKGYSKNTGTTDIASL